MKGIHLVVLMFFVIIFASMSTVQAQTSQETLNQYISDLQKNPNDYALREKIIKYVQTMKPAPAIPEEVQKYMDRGIAAIESAKTAEDFQDAAAEFMKAVTAAPWLGNGYRNLAIAQDKAGQYDAALKNLQLYLLTRPSSSDEAWAKTLMNKVEYRKEKAAKESSPAVIAEKKRQTEEEFIKKLNGAKFVRHEVSDYTEGDCVGKLVQDVIYEIRGSEVVFSYINFSVPTCAKYVRTGYHEDHRQTINGHKFLIPRSDISCRIWECFCFDEYGTITEDTLSVPHTCKGSTDVLVYKRRY